MNGLPFLKRFCPAPVQRYCNIPPVCRYFELETGDCTYPKKHKNEPEDTGILSGRNWT
jgi:hypothetical protein